MSHQRDYAGKAHLEPKDTNTLFHVLVCAVVLAFAAAVYLSPLWLM